MKDLKLFFFFFSSRRRHTRWNCDWSSDVCSSDLLHLMSQWNDPAALVIGGYQPPTLMTGNAPAFTGLDDVQRMMALDMITYLPDDILTKVDRAAMGVSLETRVPFLDHRVVEFAWRLPQ